MFRHGDRGAGVREVRAALAAVGVLPEAGGTAEAGGAGEVFDDRVLDAVRAFQQQRGLVVDGRVGRETWAALQAARLRLGDRLLAYSVSHPLVGDDVAELQQRLLDMGFDVGRQDGVFGPRTAAALRAFQTETGLVGDGLCGPLTLRELQRLARSVRGGNSHELREAEALRRRGPSLAGLQVVLDPGHGGDDPGRVAHGLREADVVLDVAEKVEGRLRVAGVDADLTRGRDSNPGEAQRAAFANETGADLLVSLHCDGQPSAAAQGVATFYYGAGRDRPSVVGGRLADLVQREVVARTDLLDLRTHPQTWQLLRLTRMPAVRLELGYLTHPQDAARLADPAFRDAVAEAVSAAIQRLFLPADLDPPTGTLRLPGFAVPAPR